MSTLLALGSWAGAHAQSESAPYNIVFVLVDDLRFDAMGFLKPGLHTPNIDFLAANGAYFPNAVVTTSLCSPSRATILTGQTARNHGVIDNNESSEAGLIFFPQYLRAAGYQTAFFGKWHIGSSDRPRPGFDAWVSFGGQGSYFPAAGMALNVDGKAVPQRGYITDELTDYALDWLEKGRDKRKPFFLYLSHKAVHGDFIPPKRYAQQYKNLRIELPQSMADTEENNRGKPLWVRNQRNSFHGVDFPYHTNGAITDYVRDYYRTLSPVDESLGRILAYLHKSRLERKTLIVFFSDNGFLFGEHGLIDKRNAYEPSIRVPMVMYAPGLIPQGVVNPVRVRNLDLAPTFLEVAGIRERPAQFEGQSILAVASGKIKPRDWPEADFIYEYYWDWPFPHTPTTFAIRRGNLKYIQYHGVWDLEELYDLAKDPEEMNNLIEDPHYREMRIELRHRLFEGLANREGGHAVPFTERFSSGAVNRNQAGAKVAEFPPQWLRAPNEPDRLDGFIPERSKK